MRIGIVCGGESFEHEISIITALDIYNKIENLYFIYLDKNNTTYYYKKPSVKKIIHNKGKKYKDFYQCIKGLKIDVVLLAVHGNKIEDGTLSGLLDFYHIPYVGSGLGPSLVTMDKELTDLLLIKNNIPSTIKKTYFKNEEVIIDNYPVIIKPARSGSSLGISVLKDSSNLKVSLDKAFLYDTKIIVEEYLENAIEYSVAVYKDTFVKCSKIEVVETKKEYFDYDEKYLSRQKGRKHTYVSNADKILKIENLAKEVYETFELKGIVRIDFLEAGDTIYVNEVNTIPGALSNYMFDDFNRIIKVLINKALYDNQKKNLDKKTVDSSLIAMHIKK